MYRVRRKNCEKIAPPIRRPLRFEAESVRSRKMRSGRSGALDRISIAKKAAISAADAVRRPIVDAEREVPLAPLAERRGQDRERGRREQRRTEPLQGAEADQRARRPGEAVEERADREQRQPGDEQPPPAEQVGKTAAEEQHAAEEDR